MSDYAKPDVLVDTDWVEAHVDDDGVRLIEVDEDSAAYDKGHIEGAVGWNWTTDLHTKVGREYVSQAELAELLSAAGVGPDTTVVLYGGNNNWFAAYAYWILKLRGIRQREAAERRAEEVGARVPPAHAGRAELREHRHHDPGQPIARRSGPGATRSSRRSAPSVWSTCARRRSSAARSSRPTTCPQEQSQVPGHVPGAANIPWVKAANEDGTFKSADELRELYEGEGITADREVIAYCRIGERSSHTWFALQELLGYEHVKNYDGSWTEYGSLVGAPVEVG